MDDEARRRSKLAALSALADAALTRIKELEARVAELEHELVGQKKAPDPKAEG